MDRKIIFKIEDFGEMTTYLGSMIGMGSGTDYVVIDAQTWFILTMAILFSFAPIFGKIKEWFIINEATEVLSPKQSLVVGLTTFVLISLSIAYVTASNFNPFIYYRF